MIFSKIKSFTILLLLIYCIAVYFPVNASQITKTERIPDWEVGVNYSISTPLPTSSTTNIAINRPVFVTGIYSDAYPAKYAVDGNTGTAWGSGTGVKDEWIYVDNYMNGQ